MATGKRWTRDELLLAMNLYRKLPFGQLHARNPVIVQIAGNLGRRPGSLAMKLCNLASLDPTLQARGIKGLSGASNLDREVWDEFHAHLATLAPQSEEAFRQLFSASEPDEVEVSASEGVKVRRSVQLSAPSGPTEQTAQVKARRGQQFFRQMILNSFDGRCCVTGIPIRELLVASHILPWGDFPAERLNPQNGLCLSRLHDAAFDQGLISIDDDYRLVLSRELKSHFPQRALELDFAAYAGKTISTPQEAPLPNRDFLRYHRQKVFKGDVAPSQSSCFVVPKGERVECQPKIVSRSDASVVTSVGRH
jgi:putative restriction endonuclease